MPQVRVWGWGVERGGGVCVAQRAGVVGCKGQDTHTSLTSVREHARTHAAGTHTRARTPLRRLGQTKPVTVTRLVTAGTVDRNILDIAQRKLRLDASVMGSVSVAADGEGPERGSGARGRKADAGEVQHMGAILAQLLAGQ